MQKSVFLIACILLIAACKPQPPLGDPDLGARWFYAEQIGDGPGCKICHSVVPGEIIVGPSLAGIAQRAAMRSEGLSAEEYIRQSILEPDAYLVEGFSKGVMYQDYSDELTEQQLNDLVAFLMQLDN